MNQAHAADIDNEARESSSHADNDWRVVRVERMKSRGSGRGRHVTVSYTRARRN